MVCFLSLVEELLVVDRDGLAVAEGNIDPRFVRRNRSNCAHGAIILVLGLFGDGRVELIASFQFGKGLDDGVELLGLVESTRESDGAGFEVAAVAAAAAPLLKTRVDVNGAAVSDEIVQEASFHGVFFGLGCFVQQVRQYQKVCSLSTKKFSGARPSPTPQSRS